MTRGVCLWGFMGAGKSTIGRALAERLDLPFFDLDARIEAQAGQPVRDIFAAEGEQGFRRREAEALEEVLQGPPGVLACGGGTPMLPGAAERMSDWGLTVFLDAPLQVLAERVGDGEERPLWGERAAALLAARRPVYRQAQLVLDASCRIEEQLQRLLRALGES